MPKVQRHQPVTVTTDGSGDATATLPPTDAKARRNGVIAALVYTKPASGGYDNNVVISVVTETTGITVWSETLTTNASKTITGPSMPAYDNDGTERSDVVDIPLANEGVTVTIASGGDTKSGDFTLVWYEM